MNGRTRLYNALNVAAITNLLDSYGGEPAIFSGTRIPESFSGDNVINFFRNGNVNNGIEYNEYPYLINCRAASDYESEELAQAVIDEINRAAVTDGLVYCELLATIPPADETDLYNTPITVIMKTR